MKEAATGPALSALYRHALFAACNIPQGAEHVGWDNTHTVAKCNFGEYADKWGVLATDDSGGKAGSGLLFRSVGAGAGGGLFDVGLRLQTGKEHITFVIDEKYVIDAMQGTNSRKYPEGANTDLWTRCFELMTT